MWVAPALLVGVVGLGLAGRIDVNGVRSSQASAPARAAIAAPVATEPSPGIAERSAAGPRAALGIPYRHDREEGTDGLMGGLAFGLPGDRPLVRRDRLNRFTIDDVQHTFSRADRTPPWVRRVGGPAARSAGQLER